MPDTLPPPETASLRDGTPILIRPIRADDAPRLQALHARLSPESIYLRFLSMHLVLSDKEAEQLANVDYRTRMAFVATLEQDGEERLIGVARYDTLRSDQMDEAEAAIVVEDRYQGQGAGMLLLDRLVAYAPTQGVRYFVAEINAENERMLKFIRRSGRPTERRLQSGTWEIRVAIA